MLQSDSGERDGQRCRRWRSAWGEAASSSGDLESPDLALAFSRLLHPAAQGQLPEVLSFTRESSGGVGVRCAHGCICLGCGARPFPLLGVAGGKSWGARWSGLSRSRAFVWVRVKAREGGRGRVSPSNALARDPSACSGDPGLESAVGAGEFSAVGIPNLLVTGCGGWGENATE